MNESFWHSKKVLVTGHTGFKGSWLSLWLQSMGADVLGYSLAPPTVPSLFEIGNVEKSMQSVIGDIRDFEKLHSVIEKFQPEIVIHMAAQPLVRQSYVDPIETYSTNVMGTVHLLESIRRVSSVKSSVIVSSDKCYENKEWHWGYRESDPMGGHDPYSNSKGCTELVTASYRDSFFNPSDYKCHGMALASARAGNVVGGGDWAQDRLVPDILRALSENNPVVIRNPHAIRPWQHVLEPLGGYLLLAEKLYEDGVEFAEAWNFGPSEDDAKPVQYIVETMVESWGKQAKWELDNAEHPHEASYLKLDCSKAKAKLGWKSKWELSETLEHIVNWQQAWLNDSDMREYCIKEIENFDGKQT